jgi:hypothetical protein
MPFSSAVRVDDRDDELRRLIEHSRLQDALIRMLSDRISVLEGVEFAPIDRSPLMTVKDAAFKSGLSESGVRKLIRENRVGHAWIGGRVFLTELPTRRR